MVRPISFNLVSGLSIVVKYDLVVSVTPVLRETEDVVRSGNGLLCRGTCASVLFLISNGELVSAEELVLLCCSLCPIHLLFFPLLPILRKSTGGGFTGLNNGDPPQRVWLEMTVWHSAYTHSRREHCRCRRASANLPTSVVLKGIKEH